MPTGLLAQSNQGPLVKPVTVASTAGSFSHEMNKMLFMASLTGLFSEHNMTYPEDLLDNSDFAAKMFEFLKGYNITPPTSNVPKFKVGRSQTQTKSEVYSVVKQKPSQEAKDDLIKEQVGEEEEKKVEGQQVLNENEEKSKENVEVKKEETTEESKEGQSQQNTEGKEVAQPQENEKEGSGSSVVEVNSNQDNNNSVEEITSAELQQNLK